MFAGRTKPRAKRSLSIAVMGALIVAAWAGLWSTPTEALAESPPWLGSKAGVSEEVLAPWTPVEAAPSKVSVLGRAYGFNVLPLPSSVVARESEVLAAPIALTGTAGGKPLVWKGVECRTLESKPNLARLAVSAEAEGLRCEGTVTMEYDGMMRTDLKLVPAKPDLVLERLALEIPLRPQFAKYLHFWPGRWGSAYNSMALPESGFRGPYKPFYWLGDEWRGLAWFAESDRNFFNTDAENTVEILREGDAVVMRVLLITVPQTLREPLEYTFGFQATPVRPEFPDAWDFRICHMGGYGIEERPFTAPSGQQTTVLDYLARCGVRTICFHEHWTDIQNYPRTTHGPELQKLVAACHDRKIQLLLYHGYEMSNIAPEWDRYHEECLVEPRAGGYTRKPDQKAFIVCYRSHWQDFMAEGIDKLMDEYHIDGVYLDGTSEPWGCRNQRHGCGYRKPDGSIGLTYPIFATRSMMKRIYTIVKRHAPEGQVNVHQSTCMVIPTLAFATSYWDGEQLQGVARPASAQDVLPLDAFRCEFMGHNFGVPAELLWYSSGPFRHVEAVSMALLHGVPVRPSSMADVDVAGRMWRALDDFGRHEAAWLPYWENEKFVKLSPADVRASLYNRPGRGLIAVVANMGPADCQAAVTLDLAALQQPGELTAADVVSQAAVPIQAGRLEVPLKSMEHVMVWIRPK